MATDNHRGIVRLAAWLGTSRLWVLRGGAWCVELVCRWSRRDGAAIARTRAGRGLAGGVVREGGGRRGSRLSRGGSRPARCFLPGDEGVGRGLRFRHWCASAPVADEAAGEAALAKQRELTGISAPCSASSPPLPPASLGKQPPGPNVCPQESGRPEQGILGTSRSSGASEITWRPSPEGSGKRPP